VRPIVQALKQNLAPPALVAAVRKFRKARQFSRPFRTFAEARAASTGYEDPRIADVVAASMKRVLNGIGRSERDGVVFDKVPYAWPVLSGLLWIAAREGTLRVCDFGGSLGSTFVQNRLFFKDLNVAYSVVEQPAFVDRGRELFDDGRIRFYTMIDDCLEAEQYDVLILSGVLQCLESPYETLAELMGKCFKYIIIDRTPLLATADDRLVVQRVPPSIYPASYPHWFFNEEKFLRQFAGRYGLIERFASFEHWDLPGAKAQGHGFIFERLDGARLREPERQMPLIV
jgi:putative methyltransferase (TIGR04325 family)